MYANSQAMSPQSQLMSAFQACTTPNAWSHSSRSHHDTFVLSSALQPFSRFKTRSHCGNMKTTLGRIPWIVGISPKNFHLLSSHQGPGKEETLRTHIPFLSRIQSNLAVVDGLMTCFALVGSSAWVYFWQLQRKAGRVGSVFARKIIHISCGPMLLLTWPFFTDNPVARFPLAIVILIVITRLTLAAWNIFQPEMASLVSRSGDPKEALQGPVYYSLMILISTLLFWKASPIGVIAICQMCFGDGAAEIAGKYFKTDSKWLNAHFPWNNKKTVKGSSAFFLAGFLGSVAMVQYFVWSSCFFVPMTQAITSIALISSACALVESIPFAGTDDNISVTLVAIIVGRLLF